MKRSARAAVSYTHLASLEPGSVTEASKDGILVAAGDAMLRIMELQAPSAKKMTAGEYVNGHKITKFT